MCFFNNNQEIINQFPEGDSLMTKFHCMAKHFSSTSANRKNCNNVLKSHLFLLTNQLEQDHNGTRIADVHELFRSALRVKRGTQECCRQFNVEPFCQRKNGRLLGSSKAC